MQTVENNTMNTPTATVKIARDKSGKFVRADKAPKAKKEGLKLTCTVTGKSRPTNQKYLEGKASRLGVSVETLVSSYVSKEGLEQIMADETYPGRDNLLRLNGKLRSKKQTTDLAKAA